MRHDLTARVKRFKKKNWWKASHFRMRYDTHLVNERRPPEKQNNKKNISKSARKKNTQRDWNSNLLSLTNQI